MKHCHVSQQTDEHAAAYGNDVVLEEKIYKLLADKWRDLVTNGYVGFELPNGTVITHVDEYADMFYENCYNLAATEVRTKIEEMK